MGELAALLRERRDARGSIDFDLPDADVVLDDEGLVVGIVPESRNVAHRLIEEFMLAANEAVAKKLLFSKQPAIYRVHDRPDPDRLVDLREVLESFGYELKGDLEEVPPSAFQRLLKQIEGKPEERLLTDLLLRAQRKALYSAECRGHYALAAPYYCHFTSPIRRYPDLIVHRQLTSLLDDGRPVPAKDFDSVNERLAEMAALSSERERRAEQAERESLLWKKIVFMKDKVGREFDAYVTGVASFGLFVTLKDFFVEGLVPVSALGDGLLRVRGEAAPPAGALERADLPAGRPVRVQLVGDRRGPAPARFPPPRERPPPGELPRMRSARRERPADEEVRACVWPSRLSFPWPSCCALRGEGTAGAGRPDGGLARAGGRRRREAAGRGRPERRRFPASLVVPPEIEKTYSAIRLSWKDSQTGKEGQLDVPLGGTARVPGSEMDVRRGRLPAGVHDGGGCDHLAGSRGHQSRRRASPSPRRARRSSAAGSSPIFRTCIPSSTRASRSGSPEASRRARSAVTLAADPERRARPRAAAPAGSGERSRSSSREGRMWGSRRSSTACSGGAARWCTICRG